MTPRLWCAPCMAENFDAVTGRLREGAVIEPAAARVNNADCCHRHLERILHEKAGITVQNIPATERLERISAIVDQDLAEAIDTNLLELPTPPVTDVEMYLAGVAYGMEMVRSQLRATPIEAEALPR